REISFPPPQKMLSPPIIAVDDVSVGYEPGKPVLRHVTLRIDTDERIALLGSNGNGKSTLVKLLANRLTPFAGSVVRADKLLIAYFAQHQLDELNEDGTPYQHVRKLMPDAPEAKVRARTGAIGFSAKAGDTPVSSLSGGEKARLLLGLATFFGPNMIILDEPTNHLDIDSRAALAEAINDYAGAVILISHDQYLLEACAERLWLIADGKVRAFDGDMADYRKLVLDSARKRQKDNAEKKREAPQEQQLGTRRDAARTRRDAAPLARKVKAAEEKMTRFSDLIARVDLTLSDPRAFERNPAEATRLSQQRADLQRALDAAEEEWLDLSSELESMTMN
ncbi:ATP-binding cassette domain-containing protein, partial [Rhodoblastus sp.]|uniref:ATP-binding cassette domain-containing protein n=1 Tax=Rhodoblastus sp. TaxID=1962975 RepID=UPI003FD7995E